MLPAQGASLSRYFAHTYKNSELTLYELNEEYKKKDERLNVDYLLNHTSASDILWRVAENKCNAANAVQLRRSERIRKKRKLD